VRRSAENRLLQVLLCASWCSTRLLVCMISGNDAPRCFVRKNSMRRFCCLPAAVVFGAIGFSVRIPSR
jgi:hypothetical protein